MTNEELDRARVDEAIRNGNGIVGSVALIAARLAREGWTPPVAVDPDVAEAEKLRDQCYMNGSDFITEFFVKAIKRGRALAAEAKPGMVWVKRGQQDVNPFDKSTLILVKFISGDIGLRCSTVTAMWSNVTHYAVITPPEDVA